MEESDERLAEMRAYVRKVIDRPSYDPGWSLAEWIEAADSLAESFEALDDWLHDANPLPQAWESGRAIHRALKGGEA